MISVGYFQSPIMLPGPAQFKMLKAFVPSLAGYGACAGALVVFIASEWKGKDLLQFVPIYNRYERNIPDLYNPFYLHGYHDHNFQEIHRGEGQRYVNSYNIKHLGSHS